MYNNFEISLVVFMPNITTNHAITYTNYIELKIIPLRSVIGNLAIPSKNWNILGQLFFLANLVLKL